MSTATGLWGAIHCPKMAKIISTRSTAVGILGTRRATLRPERTRTTQGEAGAAICIEVSAIAYLLIGVLDAGVNNRVHDIH